MNCRGNVTYLCRRASQSECLPCWRNRSLGGRSLGTPGIPVWDTPRSRHPRQPPPCSSTCPRGISPATARRTRPRATSSSTAHCASLVKQIGYYRRRPEASPGGRTGAFALTHTRASGAVQGQALRTLAAERALGVHAAAIGAHAREDLALVNVCRTQHAASSHRIIFELAGAVSDVYLPSQTSPFIRAKPREQLVSEET